VIPFNGETGGFQVTSILVGPFWAADTPVGGERSEETSNLK
jgi:hypothetical protein